MPTRNDWSVWFTAKALALLGFQLVWDYGTSPAMEKYIRSNPWIMAFGVQIKPWMEPPSDYAEWDKHPDRWTFKGVASVALPGIPGLNLGPSYFLGPTQTTFWRTPDGAGAFTAATDPDGGFTNPVDWLAAQEAAHRVPLA